MQIDLKRIKEDAIPPLEAKHPSGGWHLRARKDTLVPRTTVATVKTGWAVNVPVNHLAIVTQPVTPRFQLNTGTQVYKNGDKAQISVDVFTREDDDVIIRRGEVVALLAVVPAKRPEIIEVSRFRMKLLPPPKRRRNDLPEGVPYEILKVGSVIFLPWSVPHQTRKLCHQVEPNYWRAPGNRRMSTDEVMAWAAARNKPIKRTIFTPKTYDPVDLELENKILGAKK